MSDALTSKPPRKQKPRSVSTVRKVSKTWAGYND